MRWRLYIFFGLIVSLANFDLIANERGKALIGSTFLNFNESEWFETSVGDQSGVTVFENTNNNKVRLFLKSNFLKLKKKKTATQVLSSLCHGKVDSKKIDKLNNVAYQVCTFKTKNSKVKTLNLTHQFVKLIKRNGKQYFVIHLLNAPNLSTKAEKKIARSLYGKFQ